MNLRNEKQKISNKGITLIALVITIIVLLILAGVSIAMLAGDNGLLNKASSAKVKNELATVTEQIALAYQDYQIELKTSETTKLASTSIKIAEATQTKVENLVGHKMLLGNGEGKNDVYI